METKVRSKTQKWSTLKQKLSDLEIHDMLRIGMYVEDGGEYDSQDLARVKHIHGLRAPLAVEENDDVDENVRIVEAIAGDGKAFHALEKQIKKMMEYVGIGS